MLFLSSFEALQQECKTLKRISGKEDMEQDMVTGKVEDMDKAMISGKMDMEQPGHGIGLGGHRAGLGIGQGGGHGAGHGIGQGVHGAGHAIGQSGGQGAGHGIVQVGGYGAGHGVEQGGGHGGHGHGIGHAGHHEVGIGARLIYLLGVHSGCARAGKAIVNVRPSNGLGQEVHNRKGHGHVS